MVCPTRQSLHGMLHLALVTAVKLTVSRCTLHQMLGEYSSRHARSGSVEWLTTQIQASTALIAAIDN